MPWIVPKNKLDSEQIAVLDELLRNQASHWIRGFAGSGKSVVLIHALRELKIREPQATACVVAFTHSLKDMLRTGFSDQIRDVPVVTHHNFRNNPRRYNYIFVDEVQDLEPDVLQLLTEYSDRLIVAGDEEQSIYEDRVTPRDIESLVRPKIHSLTIVHRLTEKLKQIVSTILPNANLKGARNARLVADVRLTVGKARNTEEEFAWVWNEAQRQTRTGQPAAILFAHKSHIDNFIQMVCGFEQISPPSFHENRWGATDYGLVNRHLETNGSILQYLGSSYGNLEDSEQKRRIYLLTYHSSKGLDFETIFLPGMDADLQIWRSDDEMERRLFYVAATRSRRNLFITYSSPQPHRFVQGMPGNLIDRIELSRQPKKDDEDDTDFVF